MHVLEFTSMFLHDLCLVIVFGIFYFAKDSFWYLNEKSLKVRAGVQFALKYRINMVLETEHLGHLPLKAPN